MNFYPDHALVPENLRTDKFVLMPLTPNHVTLDYAALMSNKEMLRVWSGSPWPSDEFTLAENREDLAWHWDEHQKHIAFTYTVLNPIEDTCLGCVYIKSMTEVFATNEEWKTAVEPIEAGTEPVEVYNALVRFWTIQSNSTQNLDKTLLNSLCQWFSAEWAFKDVFWHTPANNTQQITLFQTNDLQNLGQIMLPDRGGKHTLFK